MDRMRARTCRSAGRPRAETLGWPGKMTDDRVIAEAAAELAARTVEATWPKPSPRRCATASSTPPPAWLAAAADGARNLRRLALGSGDHDRLGPDRRLASSPLTISAPSLRPRRGRTQGFDPHDPLDAKESPQESGMVCAWLDMQSTCGNYAWAGLEGLARLRTMTPILAPT